MHAADLLLPQEIIMDEVLTRLPIKSLVQCRCVCKLWNSLFYNHDFLNHLDCIISKNPKRREEDHLILKTYHEQQISPILSIISRKTLSETRIIDDYVPYPLTISSSDIHLIGSINGLVCMAYYKFEGYHKFVLWNPAIRFNKKISVPKDLCMVPMMYGFGWDSVTNDYKLIVKPSEHRVSPAAVYSCKAECWSNISNVRYKCLSEDSCKPPCVIVNGCPYWGIWEDFYILNILKFDTTNNECTYLNAPPDCHFRNGSSLIDLNGCLAYIEYIRCYPSRWNAAKVCQFDEQENTWMHMYTINKFVINSWDKKVYSFKYGGEIVSVGMKRLRLFDPKSCKIKERCRCINCGVKSRENKRCRRCRNDDGKDGYVSNVFSYNPSLVALPGMLESKDTSLAYTKSTICKNRRCYRMQGQQVLTS